MKDFLQFVRLVWKHIMKWWIMSHETCICAAEHQCEVLPATGPSPTFIFPAICTRSTGLHHNKAHKCAAVSVSWRKQLWIPLNPTPPHPRSRYLKEEAPIMHWLKTRWFHSSQSNVYVLILASFIFEITFLQLQQGILSDPPDCSLSARTLKRSYRQSWDKSSYCSNRKRVHDLWNIWGTMRSRCWLIAPHVWFVRFLFSGFVQRKNSLNWIIFNLWGVTY